MEPIQLERWRNEVLSRLEALKVRARQIQQFMDARDLQQLEDEDRADFEAAWLIVTQTNGDHRLARVCPQYFLISMTLQAILAK